MIFILIISFSCNEQPKSKITEVKSDKFEVKPNKKILENQNIYKFDTTSKVNGCANAYLQKISNDLQYELFLELDFENIPKNTEIDIIKYPKFVNIYLNKYAKGNTYVVGICDDKIVFPKDWKKPTKYSLTSGKLTITEWLEDAKIVSALTKDLILQDSTKNTILIPSENFKKLKVSGRGG